MEYLVSMEKFCHLVLSPPYTILTLLLPLQLEAELDCVEEDVDVSDDPEAGGRGPEARHHEAVEAEAAAQGGGGGGGARHHDRHRVWAYFYIL